MSTGGGGAWGFREKEPVPVRSMSEALDKPPYWPAGYKPPATVGTLEHRVAALERVVMPSELVADVLKAATLWVAIVPPRTDGVLFTEHVDAELTLRKAVERYKKWADLKETK